MAKKNLYINIFKEYNFAIMHGKKGKSKSFRRRFKKFKMQYIAILKLREHDELHTNSSFLN